MIQRLLSRIEKQGYKARILSARHTSSLRQEIEAWRRKKAIPEELDEDYLHEFDFSTQPKTFKPKSIIIVASPQPIVRISINVNGKSIPVTIPPTYNHSTDEKVKKLLLKAVEPEGFQIAKVILPWKSLAVHSGLAEYGKNNIVYIKGMGSFFRLNAFYSDLPCRTDTWIEHRAMERCQNCSACVKTCPTRAISSKRFLLHAERCLTFHNESLRGFPSWLDPAWHHCLVGCLRCQVICPENKAVRDWTENRGTFSKAETALLLDSSEKEKLPARTQKKLEELYMMEYSKILSRNMKALLRNVENS
ncbi:MAG: 4Fe-4S binding protein [Candidatus Aminicenantes bacterium]|nr:MAG: 4Fe-4S binding protein [Candidatus Aminicenantes bacterium]